MDKTDVDSCHFVLTCRQSGFINGLPRCVRFHSSADFSFPLCVKGLQNCIFVDKLQ